ncbi:tRNA dihydrouridine(20/20a) synthase DusA [Candidatus Nitrosacidococcus sp. I8]|uniref:tRNA dihydrouridine(20/20a) synthase DusA n=1 Tax=Candidatus Nitrosacidococcus sp. I8 TaxID=2942908 RepID=UPI0022272C72|nr:tRNA dihydrouridine(20/20a) synthase DusA [Candidatus Nitrosacidococcus sp. I8]CAH9014971.1 tRNA-dihydrouridine(20/20a) synthase [Candidatus Nitrosacidococcus sp. I8]
MYFQNLNHKISVAPMMGWTDRHCRYFLRLISYHVLLYTEMVTTGALIYGDQKRFLTYSNQEHPIALQLGGSNPKDLALCTRMAIDYGFDEVNLNVGCPSPRVQSGSFGVCLMKEPDLVAECVSEMVQISPIPITVKTRIGVDHYDSYEFLSQFIAKIAQAGCSTVILHSRKAWLHGLSPKENREIPPLCYETVYRIKQDFPQLRIVLNGGVITLEDTRTHLTQVDGVMIGRAAYHNPYLLSRVDHTLYDHDHPIPTRHEIIEAFLPYIERQLKQGTKLATIVRSTLSLFQGMPKGRIWRRSLSGIPYDSGISVVQAALKKIPNTL